MLILTSAQLAALSETKIVSWLTISIEVGDSGGGNLFRYTTARETVRLPMASGNTGTYVTGAITAISPPRDLALVDQQIFTITIADRTKSLLNQLRDNPTGGEVITRLFFGTNYTPALEDGLQAFSGLTSGFVRGVSRDTTVIELQVTGSVAKLNQSRPRITTDEIQRGIDPRDTAFTYVDAPEAGLVQQWGRK